MPITFHDLNSGAYTQLTASMLSVPAAPPRHRGGVTAEPPTITYPDPRRGPARGAQVPPAKSFPVQAAKCATSPLRMEWVPDREHRVVPDVMTGLCRRCSGRRDCLLWALAGQELGYWAGTTSRDRAIMRQLGQDDVDTAEWLQNLARREATDGALHPEGEGRYVWYRRGCRCGQCRSANARRRALERAKAKDRAA